MDPYVMSMVTLDMKFSRRYRNREPHMLTPMILAKWMLPERSRRKPRIMAMTNGPVRSGALVTASSFFNVTTVIALFLMSYRLIPRSQLAMGHTIEQWWIVLVVVCYWIRDVWLLLPYWYGLLQIFMELFGDGEAGCLGRLCVICLERQ